MTLVRLDDLKLTTQDALYFDFDGVLAEIGPDPDAIRLIPETAADLKRLSDALGGAVVLLSGRDVRDLAARTTPDVWRAGGHGLEILSPHQTPPAAPPGPPAAILAALEEILKTDGVRLELKGPVAAIHFRAAPEMELACIEAAEHASTLADNYVVQAGKMVVEVKPDTAHKGTALRRLADTLPFAGRRPIMLGDDTTDEDAMAAAQDLGGLGVKIGDGVTVARLHANTPTDVRAWISREANRLTNNPA